MKSAKPCNYRPSFSIFLDGISSFWRWTLFSPLLGRNCGISFHRNGFLKDWFLLLPRQSKDKYQFRQRVPVHYQTWLNVRMLHISNWFNLYHKGKKEGKVNKMSDWVKTFLLQSYISKEKKTRIVLLGLIHDIALISKLIMLWIKACLVKKYRKFLVEMKTSSSSMLALIN